MLLLGKDSYMYTNTSPFLMETGMNNDEKGAVCWQSK